MDYGMKVETGEIPKPCNYANTVLLGHSHLDHCGSLPILFQKFSAPIYSTVVTHDLTNLLLKDSLKIARIEKKERFDEDDINKVRQNQKRITYGQQFETKSATIDAFDAGHIPGSILYVTEAKGKRIMYTSDFKLETTRLVHGARIEDIKDIDVLIMESTYVNKEHPNRKETERKFYQTVKDTVDNGGIALIAAFAVGRSAELLMILDEYGFDFPTYLDGMAREATLISLKYPEFIRDPKALRKALEDVQHIYKNDERRKIVKEPCAIVTSAGMLEGGAVVSYMKYLYNNPQSAIIMTGFQPPHTAGRNLLETGRFVLDDIDLKVKMNVYYYDFSAHGGRSDLFEMVDRINPQKIICMHGDACDQFAKELNDKGYDAIAPFNGDTVQID